MASVSFISASKLSELLASANVNKDLYVRVIAANRLALGSDPLHPNLILDLTKEAILPSKDKDADTDGSPVASAPPPSWPPTNTENAVAARPSRHTGTFWFEIRGHRVTCRSSKERLAESLRAIEKAAAGTIDKLSDVKARSRRIVARERRDLFDKKHLAEKYAEELLPGWWHGTNNSDQQKEAWLRRACSLAGLKWGEDFILGPNPRGEILDWES